MYSIKLTAAGRRIGIAGRPEAVSATAEPVFYSIYRAEMHAYAHPLGNAV